MSCHDEAQISRTMASTAEVWGSEASHRTGVLAALPSRRG
jgi:hypothetical protein